MPSQKTPVIITLCDVFQKESYDIMDAMVIIKEHDVFPGIQKDQL